MALYFYFNDTTGDLVYSDQATYSVDGYTSLGEQTNTAPATLTSWVFNSVRKNIKTVTKDPATSSQIDVLTSMWSMFGDCSALTSLDLSGFDTSNVTDMGYMFSNCLALKSLDLSSFDTSSVTNMNYMFFGCPDLESLDLGGFDTSSVTDMVATFSACQALKSLDLSSFDTSNVTYMGNMFYGCLALTSLDLSGFDTSNVTNMDGTFSNCQALRIIDISPNMSNVLEKLPAATYYDAVTRQPYAKADIPGGSTYVRDLADLDLVATMVQTRMGIGKVKDKLSAQAREIQSLRDSVSQRHVGRVGDFGDLYVIGGVGVLAVSRVLSGKSSPWATILTASLPGGVTPAVITRAPIAVDDVGDACVVAVVSTSGTVTVSHRSSSTTDFGSGCNAYGEVVFPLA